MASLRDINKQLQPPKMREADLNKSAGILDDFAVRKNVNTQEGTIEKTPVNNNDIVNKAYVDSLIGGGGIDWTIDQSPLVIHANNYVDNNTTYVSSDFNHNELSNTHNLTTDINLDSITEGTTNKFFTATEKTKLTGIEEGADVTDATNVASAGAAMSGGAFHDSFSDFVANEHIDWTAESAGTVHATNYTNTTYTAGTGLSLIGTEFSSTITQYQDSDAVSAVATADDYLKNNEVDTGVGLVLTGDNSTADTQFTAQVLYGTDATPPAASGFPIGTIYIQYTA